MKKTLLLLFALVGIVSASAQSVGILGSATPTGWDSDTDMETTDGVNFTITMTFVPGQVKFRENDSWNVNWGGGSFPSGTANLNGSNILNVPAGTFTVAFNRNTGEFSFTGSTTYPVISIIGDAVGGWDTDVDMLTADGETYTLSGHTFTGGEMKWREGHNWDGNNWGADSFPTGTASLGGSNLVIPAGTFSVTFNRATGAYSFEFVTVSLVGDAVGGWENDQDLITSDGIVYTRDAIQLTGGEFKFRQDHDWTVSWGGGGINEDVLVEGGNNLTIGAGYYNVTFNRNTLEYSMVQLLSVPNNAARSFSVYPNPSNGAWNISSGADITSVRVTDVYGKTVLFTTGGSATAVIDASSLATGIYFAQISTATGNGTLKLIKN